MRVFGDADPAIITPAMCARYLRVERHAAPVRANREMALMSNLMNIAIERGDILANPCKQTRRNKERPRKEAPTPDALITFLAWARAKGGQAQILAGMAEFAALAGNRRVEFLELHWTQVSDAEIRLIRGKQRDGKQIVEVVSIKPRNGPPAGPHAGIGYKREIWGRLPQPGREPVHGIRLQSDVVKAGRPSIEK